MLKINDYYWRLICGIKVKGKSFLKGKVFTIFGYFINKERRFFN